MPDVLARFSCVAIDKIFHQQSNILSSFSKRRNLNRKNPEPIKQITPEGSAGYRSIQITIGGGDHTNVDLNGLRRSEEHTSELQSHSDLVCRLLLEKKKKKKKQIETKNKKQ